jgi:hypothetical protein
LSSNRQGGVPTPGCPLLTGSRPNFSTAAKFAEIGRFGD